MNSLLFTLFGSCEFLYDLAAFPSFDLFACIFHQLGEPARQFVIHEYDQFGSEGFFTRHGFAPTTTYELVFDERHYPPKAILGAAYEFATGHGLTLVTLREARPVP